MLRKFQVEHKILPENRDSVDSIFFRKLKRNVATLLMIWLKKSFETECHSNRVSNGLFKLVTFNLHLMSTCLVPFSDKIA